MTEATDLIDSSNRAALYFTAAETATEEPTCVLRWLNGELQQKWRITTYSGGTPISQEFSWRSVPTDAE
jgi:hypothetical protein